MRRRETQGGPVFLILPPPPPTQAQCQKHVPFGTLVHLWTRSDLLRSARWSATNVTNTSLQPSATPIAGAIVLQTLF